MEGSTQVVDQQRVLRDSRGGRQWQTSRQGRRKLVEEGSRDDQQCGFLGVFFFCGSDTKKEPIFLYKLVNERSKDFKDLRWPIESGSSPNNLVSERSNTHREPPLPQVDFGKLITRFKLSRKTSFCKFGKWKTPSGKFPDNSVDDRSRAVKDVKFDKESGLIATKRGIFELVPDDQLDRNGGGDDGQWSAQDDGLRPIDGGGDRLMQR
ncbi:hypothetical protein RHSIM_Rhsim01G0085200 [Rhododendron simsii]|uniref:Uncharacterized protein n=1 Tax=Rhododendron simsii TaxID=118357 RepID=A0A834LYI9_RHOSS|nr:hypothetical protein RHSIM_Rhsim01G0085200 [Rhododendron simsii]